MKGEEIYKYILEREREEEQKEGWTDWLWTCSQRTLLNVVYHFLDFRGRQAHKGRETERQSHTKADKDEKTPKLKETDPETGEKRREAPVLFSVSAGPAGSSFIQAIEPGPLRCYYLVGADWAGCRWWMILSMCWFWPSFESAIVSRLGINKSLNKPQQFFFYLLENRNLFLHSDNSEQSDMRPDVDTPQNFLRRRSRWKDQTWHRRKLFASSQWRAQTLIAAIAWSKKKKRQIKITDLISPLQGTHL